MTHTATIHEVGVVIGEGGMGAPAIILAARDELVPIFVSQDQIQSIELARRNEPFDRPLTHDLFINLLNELGGAIDRVRIDDLADNTFYAKLDGEYYRNGNTARFVLDVRPSDAIALAVRVNCPIEISDNVLDAAGQPRDAFENEDTGADTDWDDFK
jgi:bifunctional DNase/RNase